MTITITLAQRIADDYVVEWITKEGGTGSAFLTSQEYKDLSKKGAGAPSYVPSGASWKATQRWKFDTPSGYIKEGNITLAWGLPVIMVEEGYIEVLDNKYHITGVYPSISITPDLPRHTLKEGLLTLK